MADVLAASKPGDWRALDPENTLYMDLAVGRVVIELAPTFAPLHVANVKALAREKYYDGLAIVRVQDNYVVQWADPGAENPERARKIQHAQRNLPAEFERSLDPKLPFTPLPDRDVYADEAGFSDGFPVARDPRGGKMWLVHRYGMVGAGRDNAPDSGGGTELYAVIAWTTSAPASRALGRLQRASRQSSASNAGWIGGLPPGGAHSSPGQHSPAFQQP